VHTLGEYIASGLSIRVATAIDFTQSNDVGKHTERKHSLHEVVPDGQNQYELSMRSVLEVCQVYNSREN